MPFKRNPINAEKVDSLGRMVSHLASVHDWIEVLSDEDHVARMRVRELASRPERLDEVIAEIAMGRSIFEA